MSFAYLRLLIFLPAILIPACASSSPGCLMMYSAYKLNKQGDNIQHFISDFGVQEKKICLCFHFFPIYLPWSDGTRCHHLSFFNVEFHVSLFTLLFTFIKRLFSSSSLSDIIVISSAFLKLLIFLLAIWIPVCDSSSLAFCLMYTAYQLNAL